MRRVLGSRVSIGLGQGSFFYCPTIHGIIAKYHRDAGEFSCRCLSSGTSKYSSPTTQRSSTSSSSAYSPPLTKSRGLRSRKRVLFIAYSSYHETLGPHLPQLCLKILSKGEDSNQSSSGRPPASCGRSRLTPNLTPLSPGTNVGHSQGNAERLHLCGVFKQRLGVGLPHPSSVSNISNKPPANPIPNFRQQCFCKNPVVGRRFWPS